MTLLDYQLSVGGVVLGPGTSYIVHSYEGFGLPDVRATDVPRPRQHGEFFGLDFLAGRTVTISATIRGTSGDAALAKLEALMDVWNPDSFPRDTASVLPLSYKFPGRPVRQLLGRPRKAAVDLSHVVTGTIPITLEYRAADPRQYEAQTTGSTGLVVATGGRTYPRTYPLSFGGGVSASIVATNGGNFATRPVATIQGPATNPKIENITAGLFVKFAIVLGATDVLTVDFDARTVVLGGTASRYSTLTPDSTWWELAPGSSNIRFSAGSYDPAALLTLAWSSAWI